jgi:hypothetical protein
MQARDELLLEVYDKRRAAGASEDAALRAAEAAVGRAGWRTYEDAAGQEWHTRGAQGRLVTETLLQLEQRLDIPADEIVSVWGDAAGVDRAELLAAAEGRAELGADKLQQLRAAAFALAGEDRPPTLAPSLPRRSSARSSEPEPRSARSGPSSAAVIGGGLLVLLLVFGMSGWGRAGSGGGSGSTTGGRPRRPLIRSRMGPASLGETIYDRTQFRLDAGPWETGEAVCSKLHAETTPDVDVDPLDHARGHNVPAGPIEQLVACIKAGGVNVHWVEPD